MRSFLRLPPFQNASTQMWIADDAASGDDERGQHACCCEMREGGVRRIQCAVMKTRNSGCTARCVRLELHACAAAAGRPTRWGSRRAYPNVCQHWAAY